MAAFNTSTLVLPRGPQPPSKDAGRNGGDKTEIGIVDVLTLFPRSEKPVEKPRVRRRTPIGTSFGTLEIGTSKLRTGQQILDALVMGGFPVGDCTIQMLRQRDFVPYDQECTMELVCVRPENTGNDEFSDGVCFGEFLRFVQAQARWDLELCPPETAALLLLAGLCDQLPLGQIVLTAMNPISDSHGKPGIFGVAHDLNRGHERGRGLMVRAFEGEPHTIYGPRQPFLFVRSITCS